MKDGQDHAVNDAAADRDDGYFTYYANLTNQAQMLQDSVRTTAYQQAILSHADACFKGKRVMDVGAGNGILSLFAIQAGSNKVFAVEASNMVEHLQTLVRAAEGNLSPADVTDDDQWYLQGQGFDVKAQSARASNAWLAHKLMPLHSKVEDVKESTLGGDGKVDTLVSECLGVLLVHERMCESYIDARDRFLKPGGAMFPSSGNICFSPIEDAVIWEEIATKARFWQNANFYGVDMQPFFASAWKEAFASPVVGCFNPHTLLAPSVEHRIDFETISMENLRTFSFDVDWTIRLTALVHGIGGWFDLQFQAPETSEEADSDATADDAAMGERTQNGAYDGMSIRAPPFEPTSQSASNPTDVSALTAAAAAAVTAGTSVGQGDWTSRSSYMSTSPYATPTHWQQCRLLFPEPIAVNRGQRLVGSVHFVVNENRSYDITVDVAVHGAESEQAPQSAAARSMRRRCVYKLDKQTYSFTTSNVGQYQNGM